MSLRERDHTRVYFEGIIGTVLNAYPDANNQSTKAAEVIWGALVHVAPRNTGAGLKYIPLTGHIINDGTILIPVTKIGVYRPVTPKMVAVSAMAPPGGADIPPSAPRPPYREPSGSVPYTEFDPCLFSQAFSGSLSLRKVLQKTQQALTEEQKTVSQFKTLMRIKNEQSQLYITRLNDLKAASGRLAECDLTIRTGNRRCYLR